jgi:hypothetical protein
LQIVDAESEKEELESEREKLESEKFTIAS